jgi:hypothetical protein
VDCKEGIGTHVHTCFLDYLTFEHKFLEHLLCQFPRIFPDASNLLKPEFSVSIWKPQKRRGIGFKYKRTTLTQFSFQMSWPTSPLLAQWMVTEAGLQKNHQASTERDTDTDTQRGSITKV